MAGDLRPQDTSNVLVRRLNATIRGTLHQFANGGQDAACWTTQNGKINDDDDDDDVFYLFLQKQNLGAKLHIYL